MVCHHLDDNWKLQGHRDLSVNPIPSSNHPLAIDSPFWRHFCRRRRRFIRFDLFACLTHPPICPSIHLGISIHPLVVCSFVYLCILLLLMHLLSGFCHHHWLPIVVVLAMLIAIHKFEPHCWPHCSLPISHCPLPQRSCPSDDGLFTQITAAVRGYPRCTYSPCMSNLPSWPPLWVCEYWTVRTVLFYRATQLG